MIIPLIEKDSNANDFTCRDGEIEWVHYGADGFPAVGVGDAKTIISDGLEAVGSMNPTGTYPTATLRIALQNGEMEKARLMMTGEIMRVDPATAERLTQAILQKAAETLLDISTDLRREGQFILPFRFFTMTMTPDGTLSFPTPQGIALPADYPPHPEITAHSVTDDSLNIAIRFPVRPHRLIVSPSTNLPEGHMLRTFISYPLYIPDPKEIRGSLGSVRSATGGNSLGIRFAFLSSSAMKASVAAPEKYYEFVGNERTGYRVSSKATVAPDYSCYAGMYGYTPPFPRSSLLALGDGVADDTDPMDWIADWENSGDGYLPNSLPYKYRVSESSETSGEVACYPDGIDPHNISAISQSLSMPCVLLTRPMAFASDSRSRRNAEPRAIRRIHVHGLSDTPAYAILFGSNDCRHWEAMRSFDPRIRNTVLTPPRAWWRLLLFTQTGGQGFGLSRGLGIEVSAPLPPKGDGLVGRNKNF
ncbi:MAG: hypothetical protein K2K32_04680 [Muribaculaceae bacterium]|nr:hypothetical protein [Muribaculaceae bacterium]